MILIVDDDPNFLETAREALGRDNQVFPASDPAQTYKLAENLGFAVVLVDLELGGANGFDLIEKMHESFPHLPVIAISGVTSLSTLAGKLTELDMDRLGSHVTKRYRPAI